MLFAHGHALLVGVGAYHSAPHMNVPPAAADARAAAQLLADPRFGSYPPRQVTLLHDEAATRGAILDALDALAAVNSDDTVLIGYSGHGALGPDGVFYLACSDTRFDEQGMVVGSTAIGQRTLLQRLAAIRARRVLLLANACHAGSIAAPASGAALPDDTLAAILATGAGRVIITACGARQKSYVGDGRLTLFGQALAHALLGAGTPGAAGTLSAFDLYQQIYAGVHAAARARYGDRQEPELTLIQGVGPFPVALLRGGRAGQPPVGRQPLPPGVVRARSPEEARAAYQRIAAPLGVAVGGDVAGDVVTRNEGAQASASGAQSLAGSVTIGGNVSGSVVAGVSTGPVVAGGRPAAHPPLAAAVALAAQALDAARRQGDADAADDLQVIATLLAGALRAEREGRSERRDARLAEARAALARLGPGAPGRAALAGLIAE